SPYKKFYIQKCELTTFAKDVEAINCLFFKKDKWTATNTDYLACQELLENFHKEMKDKKILVYGSGPMAKVIKKILDENKLVYENLSRQNANFEKYMLSNVSSFFVINCLSREVKLPLALDENDTVWDLNYLN